MQYTSNRETKEVLRNSTTIKLELNQMPGSHELSSVIKSKFINRFINRLISKAKIDFAMKFVDLDRNLEYSAGFRLSPQDYNTHVLRDIILHSSGQADIYWSRLHLHTWNTNFLSGVSIWNKEEYGMSFSRPSQ
jgi:hypothetical protein